MKRFGLETTIYIDRCINTHAHTETHTHTICSLPQTLDSEGSYCALCRPDGWGKSFLHFCWHRTYGMVEKVFATGHQAPSMLEDSHPRRRNSSRCPHGNDWYPNHRAPGLHLAICPCHHPGQRICAPTQTTTSSVESGDEGLKIC